jgi:hypothetical protein
MSAGAPSRPAGKRVNLATFRPLPIYDPRASTLTFPAGSDQCDIKVAFRSLSGAQVRQRLRLTLSNATRGATIADGTSGAR